MIARVGYRNRGRYRPSRRLARLEPKRTWQERVHDRWRRRAALVSQTVEKLLSDGHEVSHALVAEQTGLPQELLQWSYPTVADLLATVEDL